MQLREWNFPFFTPKCTWRLGADSSFAQTPGVKIAKLSVVGPVQ